MRIVFQLLLGAAVLALLVVVWVWWQLYSAKQRIIENCNKRFGNSISDATKQADCILSTLRKKYGIWRTVQIMRGSLQMDTDLEACLTQRCLRKCGRVPLSGSPVDYDIKC